MLLADAAAPGPEDRGEVERAIFTAINQQRRAHGAAPLRWDVRIAALAAQHSRNMLERDFFAHRDPRYGDAARRLTRGGIAWQSYAENIFQERGHPDPARAAVVSWLKSPGHRRNLLDRKYTHTGIAVAVNSEGLYAMTQLFVRYRAR